MGVRVKHISNLAANYDGIPLPLRRRLERAVDRLIDVLDRIDGDSDLEPDPDAEPSLGWSMRGEGAGSSSSAPEIGMEADDEVYG